MLTLQRAIEIAEAGHAGQVDKAGNPYILHPRWVMDELAKEGADEATLIAAILHDTVEDVPWITFDYLRLQGASEDNIADIDALTKRKGEARKISILRAKSRPRSRRVKLKDNEHNSLESRLALLPPEKASRFRKLYAEDRKLLLTP